MVEPVTLALTTAACAVIGVVKTIYDMIRKFFENINEWRLAKIFKRIGQLVREYKRVGYLTSFGEYTDETPVCRDEAFTSC